MFFLRSLDSQKKKKKNSHAFVGIAVEKKCAKSQVCKQNFSMQELKKMNNQIMRNFKFKSKSYFKVC